MRGIYTNIQPFSIHDGPGIRTTVFLKGCAMRCAWCHNPEDMRPKPEIQFFPRKCVGCGACLSACPAAENGKTALELHRCTGCGACARTCYAEVRVLTGKYIESEELVPLLEADRALYRRSGGGVTFSGGEPLLQPDFLAECLERLQNDGIHTAVETALFVSEAVLDRIRPDLMICDLKSMDPAALLESTGGDAALILSNLRRVAARGAPFWVRTPLIPGFNDTEDDMARMAEFVTGLPHIPFVELLAFHNYCAGKYASLSRPFPAEGLVPPDMEHRQALAAVWEKYGITVKWK